MDWARKCLADALGRRVPGVGVAPEIMVGFHRQLGVPLFTYARSAS
jgi:hypothetical protein